MDNQKLFYLGKECLLDGYRKQIEENYFWVLKGSYEYIKMAAIVWSDAKNYYEGMRRFSELLWGGQHKLLEVSTSWGDVFKKQIEKDSYHIVADEKENIVAFFLHWECAKRFIEAKNEC